MRWGGQYFAGLMLAAAMGFSANAVPILINYDLITAETQEDFQSFPLGSLTPQFSFNGFNIEDSGPADILETSCDANDVSNRCLGYGNSGDPVRFFDLSANAFGLEIISRGNVTAVVQGNSGSAIFELSGGLFGFYDVQGLIDIAISPISQSGGGQCSINCGGSGGPFNRNPTPGIGWGDNLFIDDVITQANLVVDVPAPATLSVLATALFGLGLFRLKRTVYGRQKSRFSAVNLSYWPTCKTIETSSAIKIHQA